MRHIRSSAAALTSLIAVLLGACTGLTRGPATQSSLTAAPVAYDSAWARVKRAMTGEVFTFERQDSTAGVLAGTRYPSPNTKVGSNLACRLQVSLQLQPRRDSTTIASQGSWTVYTPANDQGRATAPCDGELKETIARIAGAANPPTP